MRAMTYEPEFHTPSHETVLFKGTINSHALTMDMGQVYNCSENISEYTFLWLLIQMETSWYDAM